MSHHAIIERGADGAPVAVVLSCAETTVLTASEPDETIVCEGCQALVHVESNATVDAIDRIMRETTTAEERAVAFGPVHGVRLNDPAMTFGPGPSLPGGRFG